MALLSLACTDSGMGATPSAGAPTVTASAPASERTPTPPTATARPVPAMTPAPVATPTATRAPAATSAPAAAEPFTLVVTHIDLNDLDDSVITGGPRTPVVDAAGLSAVRSAARILELYLNRVFLDPTTRFTAEPADDLLTLDALSRLSPEAKAGLAGLNLDVTSTRAGPATANAQVAILGETVLHVALNYQAQLTLQLADGRRGPVQQQGTLVFVPTPAGSRARYAEVRLLLPWDAASESSPAEAGS